MLKRLYLLLAVALLSGCSLLVGSRQDVRIMASDPEAELFVDGEPCGKGPKTVSLVRNREHRVMAKLGDRAGTERITYSMSTTGIMDLIGGCCFLLPFLGAFSPGWHELDQDAIYVVLDVMK